MKFKLLLSLLVVLFTFSNSYASFPVKRSAVATENSTNNNFSEDEENSEMNSPAVYRAGKEMSTALLLFFFLGFVAAHRWYLDSPVGWNILYILTLGGLGIWAIIDLIDIITEKFPSM